MGCPLSNLGQLLHDFAGAFAGMKGHSKQAWKAVLRSALCTVQQMPNWSFGSQAELTTSVMPSLPAQYTFQQNQHLQCQSNRNFSPKISTVMPLYYGLLYATVLHWILSINPTTHFMCSPLLYSITQKISNTVHPSVWGVAA